MARESGHLNPEGEGSKGFDAGKELIRIVKEKDPLMVVHIEHLLESDRTYEQIVREFEGRAGVINEYNRRNRAIGDPSLQRDIEAEDKEFFGSYYDKRVPDWHAFNDNRIISLEKIFAEFGADPKDPISMERLIEQTNMVIEACNLVDQAEQAGRMAESGLPRVPWEAEDEAVVQQLNNIANKNFIASIAAEEWQRLRQLGYHPFEGQTTDI